MPTYEYGCPVCNMLVERVLKMSDRDAPVGKDCDTFGCTGKLERKVGSPLIGDPIRLGITKPSSQMKEKLQQIHERTAGSILNKNVGLGRFN